MVRKQTRAILQVKKKVAVEDALKNADNDILRQNWKKLTVFSNIIGINTRDVTEESEPDFPMYQKNKKITARVLKMITCLTSILFIRLIIK